MAFESIDDAKSMGRVEPFNAVRVPCAGNLLESFESGPLPLLLLLVLGRVFALVEQQLGFVPLLARNRESNEGVFADAQQLFLAVEAVFQAPQFRAARLHEQVQTAAIGQFVSPLTLGGIFSFKFLQSHFGVSPVLLLVVTTHKNNPNTTTHGETK